MLIVSKGARKMGIITMNTTPGIIHSAVTSWKYYANWANKSVNNDTDCIPFYDFFVEVQRLSRRISDL